MRDELLMLGRFGLGLWRLLHAPLTIEQARRQVSERLAARDHFFLKVVRRAIYEHSSSPYLALFRYAGIAFEDVRAMVRADGVEGALSRLHAAGVYVSLEEFKCRSAIRRGSLALDVRPGDFDNPLPARHYEARSGGSRSAGTRIVIDVDLLAYEAAYHAIYQHAFGLAGRPMAVWRPLPPGSAGMKNALYQLKTGQRLDRWFHQNHQTMARETLKYRAFTTFAVHASRLMGRALPQPRHVPPEHAIVVAWWLAEKAARGTPALLDGTASSAVRACMAARASGLDIGGTFFRVGGEPYTPAKARAIADVGGTATPHYSMSEVGRIGVGCAAPAALDDMHVMLDKFALVQRPRHVGADGGSTVDTLLLTTLHPASPKLMLNVETDDYAVLKRRACGCPVGTLGLNLHVHALRSFEKLSSEGMSFIGSDLIRLVEDVLPARFGGNATDYQFVEEESAAGLPKVCLVISPRVGTVDEGRVVGSVLEALGQDSSAARMMAQFWRDGRTLRVVRAEPCVTAAAKILPLHIRRDGRAASRGQALTARQATK